MDWLGCTLKELVRPHLHTVWKADILVVSDSLKEERMVASQRAEGYQMEYNSCYQHQRSMTRLKMRSPWTSLEVGNKNPWSL